MSLETQPEAPATADDVWARALTATLGAVVLLVLAGALAALASNGLPARVRLETMSSVAGSPVTAGLLLGAALMLRLVGSHRRSETVIVYVTAALVVVGALCSLVDLLTLPLNATGGPILPSSTSVQVIGDVAWSFRLAVMLPRVAAGALALAALMIVRPVMISGSRAIGASAQD